jgi:hypothetical protein
VQPEPFVCVTNVNLECRYAVKGILKLYINCSHIPKDIRYYNVYITSLALISKIVAEKRGTGIGYRVGGAAYIIRNVFLAVLYAVTVICVVKTGIIAAKTLAGITFICLSTIKAVIAYCAVCLGLRLADVSCLIADPVVALVACS